MQKRHLYLIAIVFVTIVTGFAVVNFKQKEGLTSAGFYPLKDRKGIMAKSEEAKQVQKKFADLMKIVRTNPGDTKSRIALASLYIQEARITGEHIYYDAAAMKYVDEVLEQEHMHFEALTFKALIYLSRHQFAEGLALAEKARSVNPDNAFVYGILVDACVELGNYTAALENAEKMIAIRPDIRSYSRISYLREIHGDYPGAIEAMKMAVDAGLPGDEATEWARVQLGHLYETIADMKNAEMHYLIALQKRPHYPYAIAGQGRIALAAKEYNRAIMYFLQADSLVSYHSFKEELAHAYRLSGEKNTSDSIWQRLVMEMHNHDDDEHHDDDIGHAADLELAHAYLESGNYDEALEHALDDYNRRPANIDVNETVAWIYYKMGDYSNALPYIQTALKTNNKNPALLYRAGLIFAKTNNTAKARSLLEELMASNSTIEESLKIEGANVLRTL